MFDDHGITYCVIGGQAVNGYVEPVVGLDLDVVVRARDLPEVSNLLASSFQVEAFAHSLNVSIPESDLRVQIQTDPRYTSFVDRATPRNVLGVSLPVAALEDLIQGKVWAASDASHRPSKRQKDLADISRLLNALPAQRGLVPEEILSRLL